MEENPALESTWTLILGVLGLSRGRAQDVVAHLLDCLEEHGSEAPALLKRVAEIYGDIQSNEQVPVNSLFSDIIYSEMKQRHAKVVDAFLDTIVEQNLDENEFYKNLWDFVHNPLFPKRVDKAFALYWILVDRKIPYFKLPEGLRMTDDDFKRTLSRLNPEVKKIRFALARKFDMLTERADAVLDIIISQEDRETRAVLMSTIISYYLSLLRQVSE